MKAAVIFMGMGIGGILGLWLADFFSNVFATVLLVILGLAAGCYTGFRIDAYFQED